MNYTSSAKKLPKLLVAVEECNLCKLGQVSFSSSGRFFAQDKAPSHVLQKTNV